MDYVFFALSAMMALLVIATLFVSVFSYRRINGSLKQVTGLVHRSSQDIGTIGQSMNVVIAQNQASREQDKKASDHQRVLLASLNRQLVTLETMFERNESKMTKLQKTIETRALAAGASNQVVQRYAKTPLHEMIRAAAARVAEQDEAEAKANAASSASLGGGEIAAPLDGATQRSAQIPLAQHLRLQEHMAKQVEDNTAYQPVEPPAKPHPAEQQQQPYTDTRAKHPAIRSRETIDVLKMKERRIVNG